MNVIFVLSSILFRNNGSDNTWQRLRQTKHPSPVSSNILESYSALNELQLQMTILQ